MFREALEYRKTHSAMYQSLTICDIPEPEYLPWTGRDSSFVSHLLPFLPLSPLLSLSLSSLSPLSLASTSTTPCGTRRLLTQQVLLSRLSPSLFLLSLSSLSPSPSLPPSLLLSLPPSLLLPPPSSAGYIT